MRLLRMGKQGEPIRAIAHQGQVLSARPILSGHILRRRIAEDVGVEASTPKV